MQNRLTRPARLSTAPVDRVKRLARSAPERARRATDGARIRARRALRRGGYVPGLLSIVVPCYQVEDFLDECLVSLRFQHYREVEIIVVDDGSPDRSGEIARRHARRDLRVRVVTRENGGLSAARNTGIEHARGEFLTFVDSDDMVTPEAYTQRDRRPARVRARTSWSRATTGWRTRSACPAGTWIRAAHARKRLRVDLDSFPEAMVNAVAWSKTYRREFWDRAGLRFPEGRIYEDQPVSAAAFAQATVLRRRAGHLGVVAHPQRPLVDLAERVVDPQPRRAQRRGGRVVRRPARRRSGAGGRDPRTAADLVQHAVLHPAPGQGRPGVLDPAARGAARPRRSRLARGVRAQRRRPGQGAGRADRERPARRRRGVHRELGQRRTTVPHRRPRPRASGSSCR